MPGPEESSSLDRATGATGPQASDLQQGGPIAQTDGGTGWTVDTGFSSQPPDFGASLDLGPTDAAPQHSGSADIQSSFLPPHSSEPAPDHTHPDVLVNPNQTLSPERIIASLEFLRDGDTNTARAILDILHDPKNLSGYVSPHEHYDKGPDKDPDFSDIFNKVKDPDYYIVAARNESGEVVATITLHYDPKRARVVTWYLGGVRSDLQKRGVGKIFYERAAALTFETSRRTDKAKPVLILGKVILNDGNEDMQFNDNTRMKFPNGYRLLMGLPYVRHIGDQGPSIARTDDLPPEDVDEEDFFAVGLFEIRRKKFEEYTKGVVEDFV